MASERAKNAARKQKEETFLTRLRLIPWVSDEFLTSTVDSVLKKGDSEEMSFLLSEVTRIIDSLRSHLSSQEKRPRYNFKQPELARNINVSLRYDILQRDGFKCKICGRNPDEDNVKLHVDHIKPFSLGGLTRPDNLRCLCRDCNLGKKAKYEH
jgi:predicted restriction endonuclease